MLGTSSDSKLFPEIITAIPLPLGKIPLLYVQDRKKGREDGGGGGAAASLPHILPAWDTGVRLEEAGFRVFF